LQIESLGKPKESIERIAGKRMDNSRIVAKLNRSVKDSLIIKLQDLSLKNNLVGATCQSLGKKICLRSASISVQK
jgi:hypothetical protein